MTFMQFLKSLDELLYEIMSWIVFFPITLWRSIRHPRDAMEYADTELSDSVEQQYLEMLSPPTFLMLSVLLAHGVELALVGDDPVVKSTKGLSALIVNDTNLIILRSVSFAIFPLLTAIQLVRRQGIKLDRETLKLPFYSQCYATAPMALMFSLAATLAQCHWSWAAPTALIMIIVTAVWYLALQTIWFSSLLNVTKLRGFWNALIAYAESLLVLIVVGPLFA